jgi:cytochrome c-type biogenesis protein CcmF
LYPAKWAYRRHEQQPTTEVAIRRTLPEDLYATLGGFDLSDQSATLELVVNPLVDWVWLGFGVLALGTGIALLPERMYSFAVADVSSPAEAIATTTGAILLAIVLLGGTTLSAQSGMGSTDSQTQTSYFPRNDLERQLQHEIVCTCGSCGHATIAECRKDPCSVSHQMRAELAGFIDEGKSHDEIIQAFVAKYGNEEMLGAPIDRGFNRLAWLFPYLLGVGGAVVIGFAATRWSHHPEPALASPGQIDPSLAERIDDELRDLD